MATLPNHTPSVNRRTLLAQIARQRDQVLDLDVVIQDHRHAIDRALDAFRVAVRERDRAAAHLARLLEWQEDVEAVAATVGPEIAARHAATFYEASAR